MSYPLEGVRVLELGQVIAGTYGSQVLSDLAAEVIKVETPDGDLGRLPSAAPCRGWSALFLTLNRNKQSIVLNLKTDEGRLLGVLDEPEIAADPRFSSNAKRVENRAVLVPLLEVAFRRRTTAEWLGLMRAADVPCAPVNNIDGAFSEPPAVEGGMIVEYDHPDVGKVRLPGNPIKIHGAGPTISNPAPRHGEHTADETRRAGGTGLPNHALPDDRSRTVTRARRCHGTSLRPRRWTSV